MFLDASIAFRRNADRLVSHFRLIDRAIEDPTELKIDAYALFH